MNFSKSFDEQPDPMTSATFNEAALRLFRHQTTNNSLYKKYVEYLGINFNQVETVEEIPFLPIPFFKTHSIKTKEWESELIFQSSGTTGMITSKHHVNDAEAYLTNAENLFEAQYGSISDYHFLALLPSYLERDNSSLVLMMDHFIKSSRSAYSGFYLDQTSQLIKTLEVLNKDQSRKTILVGVTFALLDLIEQFNVNFPNLIVMETGGMKGRRREMIRKEVHQFLKNGFGVQTVHSEYGMTELLSQAYSIGDGKFSENNQLKILVRDINDPRSILPEGHSGGLNIIDLANQHTCAFIESQDLGRKLSEDTFEVLGRFDNSDIRGCSLLTV